MAAVAVAVAAVDSGIPDTQVVVVGEEDLLETPPMAKWKWVSRERQERSEDALLLGVHPPRRPVH